MSKTKIGIIILVVLVIGSFGAYKLMQSRNPKIEFIGTPTVDKTVYKMSYKGMKHEGEIAFGQIQSKTIDGYIFEAISQAANNQGNSTASKKIVFSIKDSTQKVLLTETKTITV